MWGSNGWTRPLDPTSLTVCIGALDDWILVRGVRGVKQMIQGDLTRREEVARSPGLRPGLATRK